MKNSALTPFYHFTYSFYLFIPLIIFFSTTVQDVLFVVMILVFVLFILSIFHTTLALFMKNQKYFFYIMLILQAIFTMLIAEECFGLYNYARTQNHSIIFGILSTPFLFLFLLLKEEKERSGLVISYKKNVWVFFLKIVRYMFKMSALMLFLSLVREILYNGSIIAYWQGYIYQLHIINGIIDALGLPYIYGEHQFFRTPGGGLLIFSILFLTFLKVKQVRFKVV